MSVPALIIDIGGGSLKVGFAGDERPKIIDNCIFKSRTLSGRTFIGDEIDDCENLSSLYYIMPFKKGYLNDWDVQTRILDNVLSRLFRQKHQYTFSDCNLLVTEPYFNFYATKEAMNEMFFEEYQFNGIIRTNPAFLAAYKYQSESVQRLSRYCLVIDSGYSFTHLIPMGDGRIMGEFVLRLNVGGKILTNRLVDIISYRHLDVRSEVHIMNQCKEDVCYVSTNFWSDLDLSRLNPSKNPILREYVLPDYAEVPRGYIRIPNQECTSLSDLYAPPIPKRSTQQGYVLRLSNERFTVPELLFHPGDVGFRDMGLTEAMGYLMCERLPPAVRPGAWANILVIGGSTCFPGFLDRLLSSKTDATCAGTRTAAGLMENTVRKCETKVSACSALEMSVCSFKLSMTGRPICVVYHPMISLSISLCRTTPEPTLGKAAHC